MTENALAAIVIISLGACLGFLFLAGGIFMITLGRQSQKKADASQSWPSVNGTIQEVKAAKNYHTGADEDINGDTFSPKLRYSYTVSGTEYSSERIAFGYGKTFNSESAALAAIQKYSQGSLVTVYYNPEHPNEAVLERKNERQIWGLVGGILLIVLGLCSSCSMILTGAFLGTG